MDLVNCEDYKTIKRRLRRNYRENASQGLIAIGHSRLVTNGSLALESNNQPIADGVVVGVHNGIVVNTNRLQECDEQFESKKTPLSESQPSAEGVFSTSDSRELIKTISSMRKKLGCLANATKSVFKLIEGSASVALIDNAEASLILATNTGSVYFVSPKTNGVLVFASEKIFLERFLQKSKIFHKVGVAPVQQIKAGSLIQVNVNPFKLTFDDDTDNITARPGDKRLEQLAPRTHFVERSPEHQRRCTKCILPESYPGICFDANGVCSYCANHVNQVTFGEDKLLRLLDKYRRNDGSYDCLVGLSGGRDSSYGIHLLKKKYGMNPLAYTYDWGLSTDQSRRNQAKVCGALGIEHIIRAPDITKKRRHIRKNIHAWLKKPEMGMVPIFMAGDKDFYHYGRELRKAYGIELTVFCSGSLLEQRQFFAGFCGVSQNVTNTARLYAYPMTAKVRMAAYYISQYCKNPRYINESLQDSIRSFLVSFLAKDDFLYLYEYLPWDENEINRVLKEELSWEADVQYGENQWRMGDGQTAFTNYIFYTVAGFSEFDNFRSNQIREGLISREEAIILAQQDNLPKWEALQYFAYVVGINLDETLAKINNIPKLY